jgi:hypothetical protein
MIETMEKIMKLRMRPTQKKKKLPLLLQGGTMPLLTFLTLDPTVWCTHFLGIRSHIVSIAIATFVILLLVIASLGIHTVRHLMMKRIGGTSEKEPNAKQPRRW